MTFGANVPISSRTQHTGDALAFQAKSMFEGGSPKMVWVEQTVTKAPANIVAQTSTVAGNVGYGKGSNDKTFQQVAGGVASGPL